MIIPAVWLGVLSFLVQTVLLMRWRNLSFEFNLKCPLWKSRLAFPRNRFSREWEPTEGAFLRVLERDLRGRNILLLLSQFNSWDRSHQLELLKLTLLQPQSLQDLRITQGLHLLRGKVTSRRWVLLPKDSVNEVLSEYHHTFPFLYKLLHYSSRIE